MADPAEMERLARARARSERGMTFEPIESLDEEPALHEGTSPEERLVAMALLCRRAWLAAGRPWPTTPRSELPGEVFRIEHGRPRRAP